MYFQLRRNVTLVKDDADVTSPGGLFQSLSNIVKNVFHLICQAICGENE